MASARRGFAVVATPAPRAETIRSCQIGVAQEMSAAAQMYVALLHHSGRERFDVSCSGCACREGRLSRTLEVGKTAKIEIVAEVKRSGVERNTAIGTSAIELLDPQDATSTATTNVARSCAFTRPRRSPAAPPART